MTSIWSFVKQGWEVLYIKTGLRGIEIIEMLRELHRHLCPTTLTTNIAKSHLTPRHHFSISIPTHLHWRRNHTLRQQSTMLPLITLEEHYISLALPPGADDLASHMELPPQLQSKLSDLGSERIKDLDAGSISLQVLSHGPLDANASVCAKVNGELKAAITKHPKRLAGFALLPMAEPEAAAKELERCVKDLGFLGALIDNHLHGRFYDDEFFWPVFQKAEELDVPIYIHPTFASEQMMDHYRGNYDEKVASALSAFGWGWHVDTGLHFLKLYCAGLFDKFPKLKIVIGPMGEMLPFQFDRCVGVSQRMFPQRKRVLKEVWDENLWITTSGMFSLPPLKCLLEVKGKEKVLFSVDYPFSANEKGRKFVEEIEESGVLTKEELKAFGYGNAERLLKVKL